MHLWNQRLLEKIDRRLTVSKNGLLTFPYDCIGRIRITKKNWETITGAGFLISSSLVLTVAHNFQGLSPYMKSKQFSSFSFSIYDNSNEVAIKNQYQIQDYRVCPQYKDFETKIWLPAQQKIQNTIDTAEQLKIMEKVQPKYLQAAKYDFALIKLSHNIKRDDYFQLYQNLSSLSSVQVCGFSDSQTLKYHSNPLSSIRDEIMYYNIDTISGQSGCPVFDEKHKQKLVGIHKGYSPDQKLNMAVTITPAIIDALQNWALQMGAFYKVLNPMSKSITSKVDQDLKLRNIELNQKLQQTMIQNQQLKLKLAEKEAESANKSNIINDLLMKNNILQDYKKWLRRNYQQSSANS